MVKIGEVVVYVDGNGDEHNALITSIWSTTEKEKPQLNIVFTSGDEHAQDSYGRQIERKDAVAHESLAGTGQAFWKEGGAKDPKVKKGAKE